MRWTGSSARGTIKLMKRSPTDISRIESALDEPGVADGVAVVEALDLQRAFLDGLLDDLAASRIKAPTPAEDVHAEARRYLERRIRHRSAH